MLQFWSHSKLGVKLAVEFALAMSVFLVAMGGMFYLNFKVEAAQDLQDSVLIPARANFKDATAALYAARADGWFAVATGNRTEGAAHLVKYRADVASLAKTLDIAENFPKNALEGAALADFRQLLYGSAGFASRNEAAFALKAAGKDAAAIAAFGEVHVAPILVHADRYRDAVLAQVDIHAAEVNRLKFLAALLGLSLTGFALLLGFTIAILISRSISRSVAATTVAIESIVNEDIAALTLILGRLADGDLEARFDSNRPPLKVSGIDEIGTLVKTYNSLASALHEMAGKYTAATTVLARLLAAQEVMKREHDAGDIDARLPAGEFAGAYRAMAAGINDLVSSHISAKMHVVDVVTRYANGDFSVDVERLPGKKATITAAVDRVKAGLLEARAAAVSNARIRAALDHVSTNAMIADENDTIIYLNRSVSAMMREKEHAIQKVLPSMRADALVGSNIGVFHKSPEHQHGLLANLRGTHRAEVELAGFTFVLTANPVLAEDGTRLGTVVEWKDRTAEVAVEKDVNGIVEAAIAGDFSKRLEVEGRVGFFRILAERMNALMKISDVRLGEVVRVLGALAKGDLTESIQGNYQGTFGQLKNNN